LNHDWRYKLIRDTWKKGLEKKAKRRERIAQIKAQEVFSSNFDLNVQPIPQPEPQKLVIHDPARGITLPPPEDGIFAVVQIGGFQYKVLQRIFEITFQGR